MKKILVAGGAGGVGEGIVRALLAAGHMAIVPSRSEAKLERLQRDAARPAARAGKLVTFVGHIGSLEGAVAIRERLARDVGPLDTLVPCLGGWWEGALLDVTPNVWDTVMDEMLRTHYVFAHVFLPVIRSQPGGGRYIAIGGGAAYHPISGSSLVSIAAAAQLMLTRALHREISDPGVDVLELVVDGPVRTRDSEAIAAPGWITADDVGRIALDLVEYGRTSDPATRTSGPIVRMRPRETGSDAR